MFEMVEKYATCSAEAYKIQNDPNKTSKAEN